MSTCSHCSNKSIFKREYSGEFLCKRHLTRSIQRKVNDEVRGYLQRDSRVGLAVSGGKDSSVMTHVMHTISKRFPQMELVGLVVHEGIEGYRSPSVETAERLLSDLEIPYDVLHFQDEFDVDVDGIVSKSGEKHRSCTYCGVLRREAVNELAERNDVEMIMTGHNADDMAQTIVMNMFQGNIKNMTKELEMPRLLPRRKPLRDVLEREIVMYAIANDVDYFQTPCPYSHHSLRHDVRNFLALMERKHPGVTYSLLRTAEKLEKETVKVEKRCRECGKPTTKEVCRTCELVQYVQSL